MLGVDHLFRGGSGGAIPVSAAVTADTSGLDLLSATTENALANATAAGQTEHDHKNTEEDGQND